MQEISQKQEEIYNIYLKYLRYGMPFRKRKDFNSVDQNTALHLSKLEIFFNKHPHVDINSFFEAPLIVYKDKKYPNISFFTTRVAIKTYSIFNKIKENQNPETQFDDIKKSLIYIGSFCIQNNIKIFDYLNYKTGLIPVWLDHYRKRNINIYSLMELGNIIAAVDDCESDMLDFMDQNLKNNIVTFKMRYNNSHKTINFLKEATKRIDIFVKKKLQSRK